LYSSANPYVGFLRHAPPSPRTYCIRTHSKKSKVSSSKTVWEGYLQKHNCSGHLPGGNNDKSVSASASASASASSLHDNTFTSYSLCRWFEASPSSGLFQLEDAAAASKCKLREADGISSPLDTLEMLNKLAYWFLFPIANDAAYTFDKEYSAFMEMKDGIASIVFPFFSSLLRKVLQVDFSLSVGTTFDENLDAEMEGHGSSHHERNAEAVGYSDHSNLFESFQSISTIDSEEIRSLAHRHLDIESILKLPTMTYEEESLSDGEIIVGNGNGAATDDRKEVRLEMSWITVPKDPSQSTGSITSLTEPQSGTVAPYKDDHCVICLDKFQNGDRLRILPCCHRFHTSCIDKWLSGSFSDDECLNGLCPTCKSTPMRQVESMCSFGSSMELFDDDSMQSMNLDGSVPSWAFARLGASIAK